MSFYLQSTKRSGNILLTWVDDDGVTRYNKIENYKPTLYTPSESGEYSQLLTGQKLKEIQFDSIKDADSAIYASHGVAGAELYGNRKFELTYLKETFGDSEYYDPDLIRGFIIDIECPSEHGFPEQSKAEWPINAITLYDTKTKIYNVWGLGEYDVASNSKLLIENGINPNCVIYNSHTNEKEMLLDVLKYWTNNYPVFVSGWNSTMFDMVYILNRLKRLGIPISQLSPWKAKISMTERFDENGRAYTKIKIPGIELVDYLDLYKKHRFVNRESYKLGFILDIEGVGSKLDFSETASDLKTLHKKDWTTYINYNICDVGGVKRLEDVLGFFGITFALAYKAGINYEQTLSPVATWENIFYKEQLDKKCILPNKKENFKTHLKGAFVKDPIPGKYKWVCSFDLNSLYPHLIMQWNISPDTLTDIFVDGVNIESMIDRNPFDMPEADVAVNPTGHCFRKDKSGLFTNHMKSLYVERKTIKKEGKEFEKKEQEAILNNDNESAKKYAKQAKLKGTAEKVRKVLLNSLYGACGEISFCFYDLRLASSITWAGQLAIQWIARYVNQALNKAFKTNIDWVIYIDTDSIYVNFERVVEYFSMGDKQREEIVDFLDRFCSEKVQPMIGKGYEDLREYLNCPEQKMIMEREVISENSIFLKKKNYAMSVWNSEGVAYNEPYIKIMGIPIVVKSDRPQVVRTASKKAIIEMLNGTEEKLHKIVSEFKSEYYSLSPEKIATPKGVNGVTKYLRYPDLSLIRNLDAKNYKSYVKPGTVPIHSRAAIIHNIITLQRGIDVQPILEGDKMKYIYLKKPNIVDSNVIGFVGEIPPELKLETKVDTKKMFEKSFHTPLKEIADLVGWSTEKKVDLMNILFN